MAASVALTHHDGPIEVREFGRLFDDWSDQPMCLVVSAQLESAGLLGLSLPRSVAEHHAHENAKPSDDEALAPLPEPPVRDLMQPGGICEENPADPLRSLGFRMSISKTVSYYAQLSDGISLDIIWTEPLTCRYGSFVIDVW